MNCETGTRIELVVIVLIAGFWVYHQHHRRTKAQVSERRSAMYS